MILEDCMALYSLLLDGAVYRVGEGDLSAVKEPARLLRALSDSLPEEQGDQVWAAVTAVNAQKGIV